MQLRNFPLKHVPDYYHLLDYNSLILEAIINPGEIKLNSLDLDYLNSEFTKLKIEFREGPLLRGYQNGDDIVIVYSKRNKLEEVEAMIGHEIIHREQQKRSPHYMEQTINRVKEINK